MPYKVWAVGEEVLAADFNDFLQEQVVAVFATTAARDAAILAPNEGQQCYVTATKTRYVYNGAAWVTSGPGQLMGQTTLAAAVSGLAAEAVFATVALTLPAARTLRVVLCSGFATRSGAAGVSRVRIRDGGLTGTEIAQSPWNSTIVGELFPVACENTRQFAGGAHTFVATGAADTNSFTVGIGTQLAVFDAGP